MKVFLSLVAFTGMCMLAAPGCSGNDAALPPAAPLAQAAAPPDSAMGLPPVDPNNPQLPSLPANSSYSYKILETTDSAGHKLGWGYELYVDSARCIRQPFIPGVSGNIAFTSAEQAQKVAELAVLRMKKYNTFPTTTIHDLDSLGIRYVTR